MRLSRPRSSAAGHFGGLPFPSLSSFLSEKLTAQLEVHLLLWSRSYSLSLLGSRQRLGRHKVQVAQHPVIMEPVQVLRQWTWRPPLRLLPLVLHRCHGARQACSRFILSCWRWLVRQPRQLNLFHSLQMFIGDGAKLVRDAFTLAKEKAPTIIFIDEVDAIGTKRFDR